MVEDFLVSHFHLPQPGYAKFLVQLVDPVSGLRVDVFPDSLGAVLRARQREVAGVSVLVLELSAVLDHKRVLLAQASASAPVEEKHYRDARLLAALCGLPIPDRPATVLGSTVYSHDLTAVCPRCAASGDQRFPLASKRRIHDILGYV